MCKTKHNSKDLFVVSKKTFSDLVGERANSLIRNSEQVVEPFLVLNIYFTFSLSVVDCTFYRSTIKSNCTLLSHVRVRSSRQEAFCNKVVLRNFAKFTEKHLC